MSSRAVQTRLLIRLGRSHRPLRPEPHVVDLLLAEEVRIGRGKADRFPAPDGDGVIRLELRDEWVSEEHARLRRVGLRDEPRYLVEDLGSTNGTRVNGQPVRDRLLCHGDIVSTGHSLWEYQEVLLEEPGEVLRRTYHGGAIGPDATMCPALAQELLLLDRVAPRKIPLVLLGETGTGKEVLARMIHRASRRQGQLVAINCAAIPEMLVEGELFGHVRGAFTGAVSDKRGLFQQAHGGTLLLDEVGDLPLSAQAKLLRLLQDGSYFRVGDPEERHTDVRILAATNQNLEELAAAKRFRVDLLARLNGITVRLPPLRERRSDLGLLLAALLPRCGADPEVSLDHEVYDALVHYHWPHNIRELVRVLEVAVTLAAGSATILPQHLRGPVAKGGRRDDPSVPSGPPVDCDEKLRELLTDALSRNRGNIAAVGRDLGRSRKQIHRWLQRLGLTADQFRS